MKFVENRLIWCLFIIALLLLFKSSDELLISVLSDSPVARVFYQFEVGNSIVFNLCIGYIVSLIFYVLVVYIPERRAKQELKDELGQAVSFVFEAFFHDRRDLGIMFHWSKHLIHCKPISEHLDHIERFKANASFKNLDGAKANMLVQSVHEVLPTFEQLVPVAFQVSHKHAMLWLSITNSIRQIATLQDVPIDDRDWGILDLNLSEFVDYVGKFYDVS
ncbi:hypothetical protein [Psychromonas antarctica]|uniref:hypothetical protein n=1 Tax=Psychromonas antarctica TaxID=67573 RepID=UPI001EE97CB6|nr:hypothetical protein [Psychromonas antarctica]MCG6202967.1 hypothetical protein [Psychromonas antarctica]